MKTIRNFLLCCVFSATGGWAATRIVVHQVQLAGPMGTDTGHLIATPNTLVFVDDVNPDNSFTIPRSEISGISMGNGGMMLTLAQPFNDMYGNRSDVTLRFQNPSDPQIIANWVGLPVSNGPPAYGERSRVAGGPMGAVQFNVRHDDDEGRLIVDQDRIDWQDLRN